MEEKYILSYSSIAGAVVEQSRDNRIYRFQYLVNPRCSRAVQSFFPTIYLVDLVVSRRPLRDTAETNTAPAFFVFTTDYDNVVVIAANISQPSWGPKRALHTTPVVWMSHSILREKEKEG